jgi:hypothetical protein
MHQMAVVAGVAVVLAGVIGVAQWRDRWGANAASLIRDAMRSVEGPDAEALRAEFRRSGVAVPERSVEAGFW